MSRREEGWMKHGASTARSPLSSCDGNVARTNKHVKNSKYPNHANFFTKATPKLIGVSVPVTDEHVAQSTNSNGVSSVSAMSTYSSSLSQSRCSLDRALDLKSDHQSQIHYHSTAETSSIAIVTSPTVTSLDTGSSPMTNAFNAFDLIANAVPPLSSPDGTNGSHRIRLTTSRLNKPPLRIPTSSPEGLQSQVASSTTSKADAVRKDSRSEAVSFAREDATELDDNETLKTKRHNGKGVSTMPHLLEKPNIRDFIKSQRSLFKAGSFENGASNQDARNGRHLVKKESFATPGLEASNTQCPMESSSMDLSHEFQFETPQSKVASKVDSPNRMLSPKPSDSPSFVFATKPPTDAPGKDVPTVCLGNFQESLWLDFGDETLNSVGKSQSRSFYIQAPSIDDGSEFYDIELEKVPRNKGFTLSVVGVHLGGAIDADKLNTIPIKNGESKRCVLTWTPHNEGGVRETIYLKLPHGRVQIVAHGQARPRAVKKKMRVTKSRASVVKAKSSTIPAADTSDNLSHVITGKREGLNASQPIVQKKVIANVIEPTVVLSTCLGSSNDGTLRKRKLAPAISSGNKYVTPLDNELAEPSKSSSRTGWAPSAEAFPPSKSNSSASAVGTGAIYNDQWAEKQCHAFKNWLNYVFKPLEDSLDENQLLQQDRFDLSSMDRTALRTLLINRRWAQAKQKATELYSSVEFRTIYNALEKEIISDRLCVRSDREVFADVGLRGQILSLLLSYSHVWLRLGLETIFAETISLTAVSQSFEDRAKTRLSLGMPLASDVKKPTWKMALKKFIVDRILSDPDILLKYTRGKCRMPSGNFEKKYRSEMRQQLLRRILLLVVFLDRAKHNNLLHNSPCLFQKTGFVKTSRAVLEELCRDCLFGEGDIVKHLGHLGVVCSYEQKIIDELDFAVSNLAVDLRDGVRLSKLADVMQRNTSVTLLKKMRLPAVSRLQKLHNVGVALAAFSAMDVPNISDINADHIVSGHRPQVLKLLWSIISYSQLSTLLSVQQLKQEIAAVCHANKFRRNADSLALDFFAEVEEVEFVEDSIAQICTLLLRWCQMVCSCFGYRVDNFTTSFADGKALCLLVHYYHPSILPQSEILNTTIDLLQTKVDTEDSSGGGSCSLYQEALANERLNSTLANSRMAEIGGIPNMLPISDTTDIPEEKSMILCVAYLCSRLIESSREILAIIVIQSCYKRHLSKLRLRRKMLAAKVIWWYWKHHRVQYFAMQKANYADSVRVIENFLFLMQPRVRALQRKREEKNRFTAALVLVQSAFRRDLAMRQMRFRLRLERAAKMIQKQYRCYACRSCFLYAISALTAIQTYTRSRRVRLKIMTMSRCAKVIQKHWRGFTVRCQYLSLIQDVVCVQSISRRYFAAKTMWLRRDSISILQRAVLQWLSVQKLLALREARDKALQFSKASIMCQSLVRRRLAENEFCKRLAEHRAAVLVQAAYRSHRCRLQYKEAKSFLVKVQTLYRGYSVRRDCAHRAQSAVIVQSIWRGFWGQLQYQFDLMDVILAQSLARGMLARKRVHERKMAVVVVQSVVRRWLCVREASERRRQRNDFERMSEAAIICQAFIRRQLAIDSFRPQLKKERAAKLIQMYRRGYACRTRFVKIKEAVCTVQACARGNRVRAMVRHAVCSVVSIQRAWRGFSARRQHEFVLIRTVIIQSFFRRNKAVQVAAARRHAADTMQRAVLQWLSVQKLLALREARDKARYFRKAVVLCQSLVRLRLVENEFRTRLAEHRAAVLVQAAYRSHRCRLQYKEAKSFLVKVQTLYRGYSVRRDCAHRAQSAVIVQSIWRGFWGQLQYQFDLMDVILAQSLARGMLARKRVHERKMAVVVVQSVVRRWLCVREASERRRRLNELMQDKLNRALFCILVQSLARQFIVRRRFLRAKRGIAILQSAVRDHLLRIAQATDIRYAVRIQTWWRHVLASSVFAKKRYAALVIQCYFRGLSTRFDLEVQHFAASEIQKVWRGYRDHVAFMITLLACIEIQSTTRRFFARKYATRLRQKCHSDCAELLLMNESAFKIQKTYLHYMHRQGLLRLVISLQKATRRWLAKRKNATMVSGFLRLQSLFRAQLVRKHAPKRVLIAAGRIALANRNARADPDLVLSKRTSSALLVLLNSKRLAEIMRAITTLETSTRLSARCCSVFAIANAPIILYSLIRSCNRSLPHVELLQFSLMTLTNVAKHPDLLGSIATDDSVDVLLDLIQMFRDKCIIFCLSASLLELIALSHKKFLNQCGTRENIRRLKGVHALSLRKSTVTSKTSRPKASPNAKKVKPLGHAYVEIKNGTRSLETILFKISSEIK